MFIPVVPDNASAAVLNNLTVDELTDLTKYGEPSDNLPDTWFNKS